MSVGLSDLYDNARVIGALLLFIVTLAWSYHRACDAVRRYSDSDQHEVFRPEQEGGRDGDQRDGDRG